MLDQLFTLVGVAIGGLVGYGGALLSERWVRQRERRRALLSAYSEFLGAVSDCRWRVRKLATHPSRSHEADVAIGNLLKTRIAVRLLDQDVSRRGLVDSLVRQVKIHTSNEVDLKSMSDALAATVQLMEELESSIRSQFGSD